MNNLDQILNFLRKNYNFLKSEFHIKEIGVFGSFAQGTAKPNSDIDILIEFGDRVDDVFIMKKQLRQYLAKNLKRKVDLCRKKYIKSYVKDLILQETIYA